MGHHSICITSEGVFLKIRTVPETAKRGFQRSKTTKTSIFWKFMMFPSKQKFKNEKILTGTDATAL
jgi:hypothetical protein